MRRRDQSASTRTAGWTAAVLLLPQVVLGTFLWLVPDRSAFLTIQVVTLAHVGLALATLPLIVLRSVRHARRSGSSRWPALVTAWLLAAAATGAVVTGLLTLPAYSHTPAQLHGTLGMAVVVPLSVHLLVTRRVLLGLGIGALGALSVAGALLVRSAAVPLPVEPASPPFTYEVRPAKLYDSSQWCGECHKVEYETWSRSLHAHSLDIKVVHDSYFRDDGQRGRKLAEIADAVSGKTHFSGRSNGMSQLLACTSCHAPLSYYSDAPEPTRDGHDDRGIGCVFCHTSRGMLNGDQPMGFAFAAFGGKISFDSAGAFSARSFFVSAPETVRRYLFQGSVKPLGWLGNMLIRWRPSMHQHDYQTNFLRTDVSCRGCHSLAFTADEMQADLIRPGALQLQPRTKPPPSPPSDSCWHCHMGESDGHKAGVSHEFLGGNAGAAQQLGNEAMARAEHTYGKENVVLSMDRPERNHDGLSVQVVLQNDLPHSLPTFEGSDRAVWVHVVAKSPDGAVVADSFRDGIVPEASVVRAPDVMAPHEVRRFPIKLPLADATKPVDITAELFHSGDQEPLASVTQRL